MALIARTEEAAGGEPPLVVVRDGDEVVVAYRWEENDAGPPNLEHAREMVGIRLAELGYSKAQVGRLVGNIRPPA